MKQGRRMFLKAGAGVAAADLRFRSLALPAVFHQAVHKIPPEYLGSSKQTGQHISAAFTDPECPLNASER